MKKTFFACLTVSLFCFSSCRNDIITDPGNPPPQTDYGVFIVNEGAFPNAGSLSFYNITKDSVIRVVVGASAGWITPNDARVVNGKLYVVVNGNNTIQIRNAETFQAIDSIRLPANSSPGYLVVVDSTKAYVANYNGTVSIVNLSQKTVLLTSGPVVAFPGGITVSGGKVFVSDFGFYPDFRHEVKILDGASLGVVGTAQVGIGAGSLVSSSGKVFAVCVGRFPGNGKVYAINATSNAVTDSVAVGNGPSDISIVNQSLLVLHGDRVMRINQSPLAVADSSFIRISGALYFYAMQVDDARGEVYVSRIIGSGGSGDVAIYTSAGVQRRTPFAVGVFPGAFAFK